ncbi:MAG: hypothetical protein QOH18_972 [Solirubrobacterales bacterium]|jgi:hypothetical protein|nr:hypothetical protein [Solirubrobacterales bacterium]
MTGRRSVIGIFVLCALALCAFGAASAAANEAEEGEAVMCEANTETGKQQFNDPHCTNPETGNGGYKHVPILPGFNAAWASSNEKTASGTTAAQPSKLATTISGIATEIECTTVTGEGTLTNAASAVSGTGKIAYKGCTVTKPAGKGCIVTEGGFTTAALAVTTVGQTTNNVKFSPSSGTEFATVPISKCSTEVLNNKFLVTGSVTETASGATLTTTEEGVTKQETLKLGGKAAGLSGAHTVATPKGLFAFALT